MEVHVLSVDAQLPNRLRRAKGTVRGDIVDSSHTVQIYLIQGTQRSFVVLDARSGRIESRPECMGSMRVREEIALTHWPRAFLLRERVKKAGGRGILNVKFLLSVGRVLLCRARAGKSTSEFISTITNQTIDRVDHRIDILEILRGVFVFEITAVDDHDIVRVVPFLLEWREFVLAWNDRR